MNVGRVYWQGAAPHGPQTLGLGPDLFSKSGCLATALAMAAERIFKKDVPPSLVNRLCTKGGAFNGDRLILDKACGIFGMKCDDTDGIAPLGDLALAMTRKQLAFIHVDLDDDGKGQHHILAIAEPMPRVFVCLDPSLARPVVLHGAMQDAYEFWGKGDKAVLKHYRVIKVRPVYAANPTT